MGQIRILILGLVIAIAAIGAAWADSYIKGTHVNLRESPEGDVVRQLDGGEKLEVIEHEGDWSHVSISALDLQGWVRNDFITGDAGKPAPEAQAAAAVITDSAITGSTDVAVPGQCLNPKAESKLAKKSLAATKKPTRLSADFKKVELTSPAKLGSTQYHSVAGPDLASISAANVNLRASPSLKADVVGTIDSGDHAYVVANSDPWYLVSLPDKKLKGWVFGDYVDIQPRVEIKADSVRLRESPNLDGRVKEQVDKGDVFYKLAAKDGWVQVASSASGLSGWVKAEYVRRSDGSVSRPYRVTGDQINFRASPAVDADVIGKLPAGATVNVLGRNEKWAYAYFEGHKGWLYTEYLESVGPGSTSARECLNPATSINRTLSWKQVGGTSIGNRLIERAKAMMGTPYVWGGEGDDGVDCSGLIYKLLCDEGCDAKCLPRRASEQMAQLGLAVDKEDLQPGDLVFFHTYKEGASHVGIYLGDGDFIHASSAKHQVAVSNLSERYYRERLVGARRITEEELKTLK